MSVIGRRSYPRRSQRALTLVECVLALMIFPLAVLAVAYAVVAGQSQAAEALNQLRAATLASRTSWRRSRPTLRSAVDAALGPDTGETNRTLYSSPNDFHASPRAPAI